MTKTFTALLLGLAMAGCAATAPQDVDLVIRHVNLIDVATGQVHPDQTVAVDHNSVVAVLADADASQYRGRQTLEAQGKYLMPGLWDMHVHFGGGQALVEENKDLLPLYVANGVTTVRDAAADISDQVLAWRAQVASGALQGPTIFTSGPKLEGKDSIWPGDLEIANETELAQALDKLQAMKVDFVKITDSALSPELYLAAVRAAKARGFIISGHIPFALPVTEISDAGLDSIEHLSYLLKAGSRDEAAISAQVASGQLTYWTALPKLSASFDRQVALANYRHLAANGTAVTPTLVGSQIIAYLDQDNHQADTYLDYIGPGLKKTYQWRVDRAAKDDAAAIAARQSRYQQTAALLPLLSQAGVTLMAGTDAGFLNSYIYPGLSLHQELALFVDNGLTPLQALQASVLAGPAFLGVSDRYGAVAPGKVADLLLLDANPLEDIKATRAIHGLVLHGQYLDRSQLDALLASAKAKVAKAG
ncbi:amidohydrolase family protein [Gallaecimonas xiamenensis]|uniref:Amidohydrolase n=1 Tax=Gallaecimonas xiamenensis 3-C-1 TaxID=745411 RepID=K2IN81_9GAMM|nr:amidohydrolase family protein [Gallaecimonas xiamenensis]EKE71621.1 amidohydrolase [Gallaecimonas xiamenensis 3-C-1]